MSGIIGSAGSKSGVIGEMGLGVPAAIVYILDDDFLTNEATITGWNLDGEVLHEGGSFGTGISESSGVFTFDKGGVWNVTANLFEHHAAGDTWIGYCIKFNNILMSDQWQGLATDGTISQGVSNNTFNHIFNIPAGGVDNIRIMTLSVGSLSHVIGKAGWHATGLDTIPTGASTFSSNITFIRLRNY